MRTPNPPKELIPLVKQTKEAMRTAGYSEKMLKEYHRDGLFPISQILQNQNNGDFSQQLLDSFVDNKISQYDKGEICRYAYQIARKSAFLVKEYHETTTIVWRAMPRRNKRILSPLFGSCIDEFSEQSTFMPSTNTTYRSAI